MSKGTEPVLYLEKAERKITMTHGSAIIRQRFRGGKGLSYRKEND